MEALALGGRIAADVRIVSRFADAEIIDMTEQMALRVLRSRAAKISSDAPIGGGAFLDRPVHHRHAAQHDEAAAVQHVAAQTIQYRTESRQRKVMPFDVGDVEAARPRRLRRRLDL